VERLLKAIEEDILVEVKRLLKSGNYNLNLEVEIGTEYDLDEVIGLEDFPSFSFLFLNFQKGHSSPLENWLKGFLKLGLNWGIGLLYTIGLQFRLEGGLGRPD